MSAKNSRKPRSFKKHKVGEIIEQQGVKKQVVRAVMSADGKAQFLETSVAPIVKARGIPDLGGSGGYITADEKLGGKIEHFAPPFVPRGVRRDSAKLKASDWNFKALLDETLATKKVALFHELARESARIREACRIAITRSEGLRVQEEKEGEAQQKWHDALLARDAEEKQYRRVAGSHWWKSAMRPIRDEQLFMRRVTHLCALTKQAERQLKQLRQGKSKTPKSLERRACLEKRIARLKIGHARLVEHKADCTYSHIQMNSKHWPEQHARRDAWKFLNWVDAAFPFGTGEIFCELVANDVGWNEMTATEKSKVLKFAKERSEKGPQFSYGLVNNDMPPRQGEWCKEPLQIGSFRLEGSTKPYYRCNDGETGRGYLVKCGNGNDAVDVLTESLECCVCFNFADDVIIGEFRKWLEGRRAHLGKQLPQFMERKTTLHSQRTEGRRIDAALKGLSALRLCAAMKQNEASGEWHRIYFPNQTHRVPYFRNLEAAMEAVTEWQQAFFPYCPFDSQEPTKRELGMWDYECPMCFLVRELPRQSKWNYDTLRCPACDYREDRRWTAKGWVRMDD